MVNVEGFSAWHNSSCVLTAVLHFELHFQEKTHTLIPVIDTPSTGNTLATVLQAIQKCLPLQTLFDLASLTKVLATTTAAMILYQGGQLDLGIPYTLTFCGEFILRNRENAGSAKYLLL